MDQPTHPTVLLSDDEALLLESLANKPRLPLIIERPQRMRPSQRLTNYFITLICWSIWFYLALPVVTFLLWLAGGRLVHKEFVVQDGMTTLVHQMPLYSISVAVLCGSLISWALTNWWRFADRERRKTRAVVTTDEQATYYALDQDDRALWQGTRRLLAFHDEAGIPVGASDRLLPTSPSTELRETTVAEEPVI